MRIALAGPLNQKQKEALCLTVAKKTGIEAVCNLTQYTLSKHGLLNKDLQTIKKVEFTNSHLDIIDDRIRHISCRDNLITETCGLDWLAQVLLISSDIKYGAGFEKTVALAVEELDCYDLVIILPFLEPITSSTSLEGLRTRMLQQGLVDYLADRTKTFIVEVPDRSTEEELVEDVFENIIAEFSQFKKYLSNT